MMRRRRMSPTSLGPGDLEQVTSGAPEDVKISRMRVAAQRLLHQRQPVHAFAHVSPTDCWPHSNPARNRDHRRANASTTAAAKRATPKPGSARALPANSISIAGTGGMATPSPARATTPERTHWPRLEDPAASDRSNSASRRPVAPRLAPLHLPERRLLLLAAPPGTSQDRPEPRRLPSHRLLQWRKHRCLRHCAIRPHQPNDERRPPRRGTARRGFR